MRTLLIATFLTALLASAGTWWIERGALRAIEAEATSGRALQALARCDRLRKRDLVLIDSSEVEALCTEVASLALHEAVSAESFELAAALSHRVGDDAIARAVVARLPGRHVVRVRDLIRTGDFEAAREELDVMPQLYREYPAIIEAVANLELSYSLALARQRVSRGDVHGALRSILRLPTDLPLPLQAESESLATAAMRQAAESRYAARDFSGLYEFFSEFTDEAGAQPRLRDEIERLQAEYDQRLFGTPVTHTATRLTPAVAVEAMGTAGQSVLRLSNLENSTLTVALRGPEDRDLRLPAKQEATLELKPGRYVLLVRKSKPVVAAFGSIEMKPYAYRQTLQTAARPLLWTSESPAG